MLSMEMYPTLALGPQRMADSFYRGEIREEERGEREKRREKRKEDERLVEDRRGEERRREGKSGEREVGIFLSKSDYLSEHKVLCEIDWHLLGCRDTQYKLQTTQMILELEIKPHRVNILFSIPQFALIPTFSTCLPTDRQASNHLPLYPATCDLPAKAPPPRLLPPPQVPKEPAATGAAPQKDDVQMELENSSLWKQFSSVGTEMIITKKGR